MQLVFHFSTTAQFMSFRVCWASSIRWIVCLRSSNKAFKLLPTKDTTTATTAAKLMTFVSKIFVLIPKPWPKGKLENVEKSRSKFIKMVKTKEISWQIWRSSRELFFRFRKSVFRSEPIRRSSSFVRYVPTVEPRRGTTRSPASGTRTNCFRILNSQNVDLTETNRFWKARLR